jgi:hypothetical protein
MLPLIPQALYWKSIAGSYLYYSYDNPGEGFELLYPYTLRFLFSFRKGWFIYTPVMIFAIIGLYYLYKSYRPIMLAVVIFLVADIYLISSWSCWWYAGGSFSSRALVPAYVVLALPLGYFLKSLQHISKGYRIIIFGSISFFILLNLFQTWQFRQGIIDKERMTLKYYLATFGKVKVEESDRKLLLVERYTESDEYFVNDGGYKHKTIYYNEFEGLYNDSSDVFILDKDHPFSPGLDLQYKQITGKDHFWVRARADVFIPEGYSEDIPLLVISFHHKGKPYKYRGKGVIPGEIRYNDWNELGFDYLSPEVRSLRDNLKVYIWHRGTAQIQVDDLRVDVYEPLN